MTPATEAKTAAILLGLNCNGLGPRRDYHVAQLLAMLTSSNKEEREQGKGWVRGYVAEGERVRIRNETAAALAGFANRNEP